MHAGDRPSMTPGKAELDVRLGLRIRMEPSEGQDRLIQAVHGRPPKPEPSRATTDLRFFTPPLRPGQAVCYGPSGDGLHGVDEWVDLESIAALLLHRWDESA
jgi:acetylornithine deacetylase/succinyl-diaminopimelate desuccinylase-like protein